jgi:hypothetical protein
MLWFGVASIVPVIRGENSNLKTDEILTNHKEQIRLDEIGFQMSFG